MKCAICIKEGINAQQKANNNVKSGYVALAVLNPLVTDNAITIYNGTALCYVHLVKHLGI